MKTSKIFLSILTLTFVPSLVFGNDQRMSTDQISSVIRLIAPTKEILHEIEPIKPPTMIFVWHGFKGTVSDILSEKDPFTGKQDYEYSIVNCSFDTTYFTSLLNKDVHVAGALYLKAFGDGDSKFVSLAYGATNILRSSITENNIDVVFGYGSSTEDKIRPKYPSRKEAMSSIESECSMKNLTSIELTDMSVHFETDGFLVRGTEERIPTFGNAKILIME